MTHGQSKCAYDAAGRGPGESRTPRVGVLTIGQSPRPDRLGDDIQAVLGESAEVVERGALDGLAANEVRNLAPHSPDDYRLITLLRDRQSVEIRKDAILPLLQQQINIMEQEIGVGATLLMCTGSFPSFDHERPLLAPQEALYGAVTGMAGNKRIGAMIPLESQEEQAARKWRDMSVSNVDLFPANPYGEDPVGAVEAAAEAARRAGDTILFMDCFGYNREMKLAAQRAFGGPVVLARTLAARLIAEVCI